MTFALALNRYRATEAIALERTEQPYEVVLVTLKELGRALEVLAVSQESGRPYQAEHLNRALTAIYILQTSLDFEEGGDLALDLFQLYEFSRFHVIKAWKNEDDARLRDASDAMAQILAGWREIRQEVPQSAARMAG